MHRLVQLCERVEPVVLTLPARDSEFVDKELGCRVVRVITPPLRDRRGKIAALNAVALMEAGIVRPDLVLSGHIVTSPAAQTVARMTGTPYVQYLYGKEAADRPRLARFAAARAAAVIAISRYTAGLVPAPDGTHTSHHLIAPGVDATPPTGEPRADKPTVVTIARLSDRYKGHDVMIRAMPLVRARAPDAKWVVIGDGPMRVIYENQARGLGLKVGDGIEFLGSLSDAERDRWLDRAHVFAMPSRLSANGGGEGFGIVYLEAGAHQLPVVAGNVGGAPDAVVDGETGMLVDPTDHIAVADAITELLLDPGRAENMGKKGEARAREFAWPKVARQVEDVLLEVAARHKR